MRAVTLAQLDAFQEPLRCPMTTCRFCGAPLEASFADLGMSPLANSYVAPEQANAMEPLLSRCTRSCARSCFLVQLEEYESPDADLLRLRVLLVVLATGSSTRGATSRR